MQCAAPGTIIPDEMPETAQRRTRVGVRNDLVRTAQPIVATRRYLWKPPTTRGSRIGELAILTPSSAAQEQPVRAGPGKYLAGYTLTQHRAPPGCGSQVDGTVSAVSGAAGIGVGGGGCSCGQGYRGGEGCQECAEGEQASVECGGGGDDSDEKRAAGVA